MNSQINTFPKIFNKQHQEVYVTPNKNLYKNEINLQDLLAFS